MQKLRSSKLGHFISNLIAIVSSIIISFLLIYKLYNININFNILMLNLMGCFLGSIIYLLIIIPFHKNKGNTHDKFKVIFNAIDKISNGDFSIFIEEDDSKHNHLTNELITKVNNMAKQLNSMEVMRQDFVSNVSHEIQSPLTSIMGFSALLKDEKLSHEDKEAYLNIIDTETKRLSKLSDNLLKLSALDSGAKELQIKEYNLDRQIKDIILSLEPQWAKKGIEFEIDCPRTSIYADQELMSEVWINLLNNGIKFTPYNSKMYVTMKKIESDIKVIVRDSGIGISKEEQKRIFERFYMVDKSRKRELGGNGLGLAITKKIIDLHKGSIKVESEINKGASFIITLPFKNDLKFM